MAITLAVVTFWQVGEVRANSLSNIHPGFIFPANYTKLCLLLHSLVFAILIYLSFRISKVQTNGALKFNLKLGVFSLYSFLFLMEFLAVPVSPRQSAIQSQSELASHFNTKTRNRNLKKRKRIKFKFRGKKLSSLVYSRFSISWLPTSHQWKWWCGGVYFPAHRVSDRDTFI